MRFIFQYWLLLPLLLCGSPLQALAPPHDGRCDFTDCSQGDGERKDFDAAAGARRECTHSDDLRCRDTCHGTFDEEFKECVSDCLSKSCETQRPGEDARREKEDLYCIETESKGCQKRCSDMRQSSARDSRCREECLLEHCRHASRLDIATESADPGKLACDRCREQQRFECARDCALGTVGNLNQAGLAQFGCEKLCLMSVCSESCGARAPF